MRLTVCGIITQHKRKKGVVVFFFLFFFVLFFVVVFFLRRYLPVVSDPRSLIKISVSTTSSDFDSRQSVKNILEISLREKIGRSRASNSDQSSANLSLFSLTVNLTKI